MQLPDVPGEFSLPSVAAEQVLQTPVGVAQEGRLPVLTVFRGVTGVEELNPLFDRPVQQRGHRARCDQRDDRARDGSGRLALALVVPTLQGVLQLHFELATIPERPEVEAVVAVGLAEHRELVEVRPTHRFPARPVVDAELRPPLRPQRAAGQRADRVIGIVDRVEAGQPCRAIRFSRPFPESVVPDAQPSAGATVAASGRDADGEFPASESLRRGGCGEPLNVGAAFVLPLVVVALAEPAGARLSDAARHPARRGVEHQRAAFGDEDVDPELRADRGHQLAQQSRCRHRRRCGGHHRTSCPVRKPAESRARRASSADRWP